MVSLMHVLKVNKYEEEMICKYHVSLLWSVKSVPNGNLLIYCVTSARQVMTSFMT